MCNARTLWLDNRPLNRIVLCSILFIILFFSFKGEKVAYNEGAGWDGLFYREVVQNFSNDYFDYKYDRYRIQRVAPFAILNIIYNIFDLPKDNHSVLVGALCMQLVVICCMLLCFFKFSTYFSWSLGTEIIAFSSFFFTFMILKVTGYYPLYLDPIALLMAMMSLYYYLKRKRVWMCVIAAFAMVTWPFLSLCILLLAFFPSDPLVLCTKNKLSYTSSVLLILSKASFIFWHTFLFLMLLLYQILIKREINIDGFFWATTYINIPLLCIALLCVPFFYYRAVRFMNFDVFQMLRTFSLRKNLKKILFSVFLFCSFYVLSLFFASNESGFSLFSQLLALLFHPLTNPFVFLETVFLYYGLVFVLIILFWKQLLPIFLNYGSGYLLLILFSLLFVLDTDSRKLITFLPFYVIPLMSLLDRVRLRRWVAYLFAIYSLIFSFCWYSINVPGIEQAFMKEYNSYITYPAQRWFMFSGPWQSHQIYILFLLIGVMSAILIVFGWKRGWFTLEGDKYE